MHREKITVAFHEMDKTAKHVAQTIDDLTQDIDRNNLVILCGENHAQDSHQFFQTQLMRHLHDRDMVSVLCAERKGSDLLSMGVTNPAIIKKITGLNLTLNMQILSAVEWGIPVHFMDVYHDKQKSCTSGAGIRFRDVHMAQQIMQQNGTVMTTNGRTHVRHDLLSHLKIGSTTLTKRVLAEDKQVVAVTMSENNFLNTLVPKFLGNILTADERKNMRGIFHVALPSKAFDLHQYRNRDDFDCYEEWRAMEKANNVAPLAMNVLET